MRRTTRRKAEGLAAWCGRHVEVRVTTGAVFRGKFMGVVNSMVVVRRTSDRDVLVPLAYMTAMLDEDSHAAVALGEQRGEV